MWWNDPTLNKLAGVKNDKEARKIVRDYLKENDMPDKLKDFNRQCYEWDKKQLKKTVSGKRINLVKRKRLGLWG